MCTYPVGLQLSWIRILHLPFLPHWLSSWQTFPSQQSWNGGDWQGSTVGLGGGRGGRGNPKALPDGNIFSIFSFVSFSQCQRNLIKNHFRFKPWLHWSQKRHWFWKSDFDSYFWLLNKSYVKINALFVISAIRASIRNGFLSNSVNMMKNLPSESGQALDVIWETQRPSEVGTYSPNSPL